MQKKMIVKNKNLSHNDKDSKKYDSTLYRCNADDIWINIEVPKHNDLKSGKAMN